MVTAHTETRAGALPAWFKPEEFAEPDFDAAAYVANLQRYVRGSDPDMDVAGMDAPDQGGDSALCCCWGCWAVREVVVGGGTSSAWWLGVPPREGVVANTRAA